MEKTCLPLLGQLIYTSFEGEGFKLLASEQVPIQIQQIFRHRIIDRHWDSMKPAPSELQAVYLYQTTLGDCLFGWFYNDAIDEFGRNIPYFICYYYPQQQHSIPLEKIFLCLHKGPVNSLGRQNVPAYLDAIRVSDTLMYQSARKGVVIPLSVRSQCNLLQQQKQLLNISFSAVAHQISPSLQIDTKPTRSHTAIQRKTKLATHNSHIIIFEVQDWIETIQAIQALKQCKTVILKLNCLEPMDAQRAADFVQGGLLCLEGHAEWLNDQTLLLLPKVVVNERGTNINLGYVHPSAS